MKKILLLTDFSDNAHNAIHYAMHFFKSEICAFHVMHVHKARSFISDDLMTSSTESVYESFTKVPKQKLNTLVEGLKETYNNPNHTFEIIVDFDVFTDAISQAVKSKGIDIIVMGSNGATGAQEIVFGSNTIKVMRHVVCKTLIVPTAYTFKSISNFLLPLQFNDVLHSKQLDIINNFIQNYKLKLHVLRVCSKDNKTDTVLRDKKVIKKFNCYYSVEEELTFYQAVKVYLETNTIDMTGLIVHDKTFIQRLFTESPAVELSKIIKLPLMIFHSKTI
jgi:nucleotide-binding universal stress UspA family protein